MHFQGSAYDALAQVNRDALPDLCTVEVATRTETATGGTIEDWQPVAGMSDMPCRVSQLGTPRERMTPSGATESDYTVAFDGQNAGARVIPMHARLQCVSGPIPTLGVAWAVTLYVHSLDGVQSLDPFPKLYCGTVPQPGQ